ncbi:hypothetical protein HPB50_017736 [Hyalomma asiaticum]|uniref:Uncharacterized protein n=1 Tax=Hyalomma asiaticum TaxID=266040 RepID=A0ACB7SWP2_HYAAI|nr:hypothetical protein HPB50_017736 [Hyalomma asiaticum]
MEPTARKTYEEETGRTVTRIGLVISKVQSWLCCSPDGLSQDDGVILIEIKCPFRCRDKPIHENATLAVDYLHVLTTQQFMRGIGKLLHQRDTARLVERLLHVPRHFVSFPPAQRRHQLNARGM